MPNSKANADRISLLAITLIMGMGSSIVFSVMPLLGRELALDKISLQIPFSTQVWYPEELAITVFSALSALVFFFAAPYWGRTSDLKGRRNIVIMGIFGSGLGTLVFCVIAWAGQQTMLTGVALFAAMFATRAIYVFLMAAVQPAVAAYVIERSALEKRAKQLSRVGVANQLGMMLGPTLAAAAVFGTIAPFLLHAGLSIAGGIAIWIFMQPDGAKQYSEKQPPPPPLRTGDQRVRPFLLLHLACFICLGTVQQTLAFYIQDKFDLAVAEVAAATSYAMLFSAFAMMLAQLLVVPKLGHRPLLLARLGLPVIIIGNAIILSSSLPSGLYLGMAFVGLGQGMAIPGITVAASYTVASNEQGGLQGLFAAYAGMGFVIGPLIGGIAYSQFHNLPYWIAIAGLIPASLYALRLKNPKPVTD